MEKMEQRADMADWSRSKLVHRSIRPHFTESGLIIVKKASVHVVFTVLTHSHTMTPFDAPGKQAF